MSLTHYFYRAEFKIKPLRYNLPSRIEEREFSAFSDKDAVKKAKVLSLEKDIALSECNTARCYLVSVKKINQRKKLIPEKTTNIPLD